MTLHEISREGYWGGGPSVKGVTLNEIARSLGEVTLRAAGVLQPSAWWQYPIADDVVISVRAGASPWRLREVQRAVREMAVKLKKIRRPGQQKSSRRLG